MCNNDQFIVAGGNPVPAICGTNTGNHSEYTATKFILEFLVSHFTQQWLCYVSQVHKIKYGQQKRTVRHIHTFLLNTSTNSAINIIINL
jgi:hypothetical protein